MHEKWDWDLGVDLTLGPMGQEVGHWNLTLATGPLNLGPGTGTQVLGAGTATLFGTENLGPATMVLGFGS